MAKVDVGNFMGVINATINTAEGIEFPGANMPSGNPVRSPGVTTSVLADRSMAEQWYHSIKGQYEREKSEINHDRGKADAPDIVIGGANGTAEDGGRGEPPAPVHQEASEEELPRTRTVREELEVRRDYLRTLHDEVEVQYEALGDELQQVEAALEAIDGL